jgi:flagellar hook-associated protein 2
MTFDDNGGAGYVARKNATAIGGNAEGVDVKFSNDNSSMSVGDRFSVDVFDPLLQASQDAITVVDGITAVTQSNDVQDVIAGITLNLVKVDIGNPVTVSVGADTGDLVGELDGIAVSLNGFAKFVRAMSKYDPQTKSAGILSGDAAVRGMNRTMRNEMVKTLKNPGNPKYDSLISLGYESDKEGNVKFDSAKFLAAYADDKEAVLKVIKDFGSTSTSKIKYETQTHDTKAGVYEIVVIDDGVGGKTVTVGGLSVNLEDDTITGSQGSILEGLKLEIKDLQGESVGSLGTVTVTKGILDDLGRAANSMTHANTGIIAGKKNSIDKQILSLNEQITRQERRVGLVEKRLRKRFTDLEIAMGRMQSTQDFITQQIAQLNKDR